MMGKHKRLLYTGNNKMKVNVTYIIELPEGLHGDDIEEHLEGLGESINGRLDNWC